MASSSLPTQVSAYDQLRSLLKDVETLGSIGSLLGWDQETYMPGAGAAFRSDQQALVSALAHEKATSPKIGELIAACESDKSLTSDPLSQTARSIREMRRDYDKATKLPTELVSEIAKVSSQSQEVWKHAREKNDFPMFQPWLEKMIGLMRRKAECLGTPSGGELYDALLDEYEPGARAKEIEAVFLPLADRLSGLVKDIAASSKKPSDDILHAKIDVARQHELGQFVLKSMGFDFEAGRLDTTTHPFCSGLAPGDTRLTTRYREQSWTDALYSSMHEAGHGLYEQGLPKAEHWGTPLAQSISLGIHESQSRMWENFVGRSREFWTWLLPHARKISSGGGASPSPLAQFSVDEAFAAVNTARPSLIRVEADEATYNLHVLIRFKLERALISGAMSVKEIPFEWNRAYKQYLGVDVPDDRRGCLQDVHWSFGLIGYFPTYTLGNLYAAQFWETINAEIPNLRDQISRGEFAPLKTWLNQKIHAHGRRYLAGELCLNITGKPLSPEPLMRYLEGKLRPIYR